jgi:inhibitor of KinA
MTAGERSARAIFLACGDSALSIQLGDRIDRGLGLRVLAVKAAIDAAGIDGVVETVPSYRALLVHYNPLQISFAELVQRLEPPLEQPSGRAENNLWRMPCCYHPDLALDLNDVAQATGLSMEAVMAMHSGVTHYVYMLGFAPGQPYLGDLPRELDLPRRKDPRGRIDKGSVATATGLTVIYPIANACGWHVIGRTPVPIFDPRRERPALLRPGDRIIFEPVELDSFREIEALVEAGSYVPVCEAFEGESAGRGGVPA